VNRKRLLALAAGALALVVVFSAAMKFLDYRRRIIQNGLVNREHFVRLSYLTMTRAEVYAALGGPPGDFRTDQSTPYKDPSGSRLCVSTCPDWDGIPRRGGRCFVPPSSEKVRAVTVETWIGDEGCVIVAFNEKGRSQGWAFGRPEGRPTTSAERLRSWLRRRLWW
jgi:hypothetical protein